MSKYNWTIYDLEEKLKHIKKRLETEKNEIMIQKLKTDILELEDIIFEHYDDSIYEDSSLLELFQEMKESLAGTEFLWNDFCEFQRIADSYIPHPDLKKTSLSKDDMLTLTHDFYKSLNPFFFGNFMKNYCKRNDHIVFRSDKDYSYAGETIPIRSTNESYIQINRSFTFDDVLTTIHEYSHATSTIINPKNLLYPKSLFGEIDSIFMEMIANDFIKTQIKTDDATYVKGERHNQYIYILETICNYISLLKSEKSEFGFRSNKHLKTIAQKECNIQPSELEDILYDPYPNPEKYITGYIFAVELYALYKQDKEKALDKLKRILLLDSKSEEEYYSNIKRFGFIPNLSMQQFHNNIENEILSLTRKRND